MLIENYRLKDGAPPAQTVNINYKYKLNPANILGGIMTGY